MRKVKGKNTKPELAVRSALHKRGLRYRLNRPLPGKLDIVFVKAHVVVFLDSCFWHGCPRHLRMPKSNQEYWEAKIGRTVERDVEINAEYARSEWMQLRFWEHDLKEDFDLCVDRIETSGPYDRLTEPFRSSGFVSQRLERTAHTSRPVCLSLQLPMTVAF